MNSELNLLKIIRDEKIHKKAIEMDAGLFVNEHKHAIYYLTVKYSNFVEVYLEINDDGGPPYKNIFVKGQGETLEEAKAAALKTHRHLSWFEKENHLQILSVFGNWKCMIRQIGIYSINIHICSRFT